MTGKTTSTPTAGLKTVLAAGLAAAVLAAAVLAAAVPAAGPAAAGTSASGAGRPVVAGDETAAPPPAPPPIPALSVPALSASSLLAAPCAGCHGPAGASVDPATPALAGRSAATLAERLTAFRDDAAPSTVMGRIARGYDDRQIAALAAYFAALPADGANGSERR